jgi:hypothetical protein
MTKSYNTRALRGETEYSDHEFKQDLLDSTGIVIPEHLLYRPEMNSYVLNEVHNVSKRHLATQKNPDTGALYTPQEAEKEASALRSQAQKNINDLM